MNKIIDELQLGFDDVRILPQKTDFTSRKDACVVRSFFSFPHAKKKNIRVKPIIAANMSCGSLKMAKTLGDCGWMTALNKNIPLDDLIHFWKNEEIIANEHTFYTMGITENDQEKYNEFSYKIGKMPQLICIDVANGGMVKFLHFINKIRFTNPNAIIMAGNVVTAELAKDIILAGADIVKVGIAYGASCLTSKQTGCARPQLSTVLDTTEAVHNAFDQYGNPYTNWMAFKYGFTKKEKYRSYKGFITSDGGCSEPGHVAIAFCAGADFVMLGTMLGGTDECDGEIIEMDGKKYKKFYGMSSNTAMQLYNNGTASYKTSEGRTVLLPYKGSVKNVVEEIEGGLNSMLSYVGIRSLYDLSRNTKPLLIRVNSTLNRSFEKYTIGN